MGKRGSVVYYYVFVITCVALLQGFKNRNSSFHSRLEVRGWELNWPTYSNLARINCSECVCVHTKYTILSQNLSQDSQSINNIPCSGRSVPAGFK